MFVHLHRWVMTRSGDNSGNSFRTTPLEEDWFKRYLHFMTKVKKNYPKIQHWISYSGLRIKQEGKWTELLSSQICSFKLTNLKEVCSDACKIWLYLYDILTNRPSDSELKKKYEENYVHLCNLSHNHFLTSQVLSWKYWTGDERILSNSYQ